MPAAPLFWLVALLLVGVTVAALVWPLLRARAAPPIESEDLATTDVYRDHKRQLDAEWAAGAITREERDASLDELTMRLSSELGPQAQRATASSTRASYVAALVLAAALPVTALALYAAFGSPGSLRVTASADDARAPKSHDEITTMVEKLATRMKERPEDPEGWRLLARAYSALGRYDESVAAFAEAAKRGGEDAALLADWADALAVRNQSLEGEPSRLIARALAIDPNYPKALSLSASAAFYRRDFDTAIAEWRKLQTQYPPGSQQANDVAAMITEADAAKRGVPMASAQSGNADAVASPDTSRGANATVAAANGAAGAAVNGASQISGSVSIDPKLRERAAPGDTLFIYARAAQGPRMPLAIVRASASDLPRSFTLDDSMAMTPTAKLSNASDVIVEARISKSGKATPAPGDLVGASGAIKPGSQNVSIVINDVVQ
jgi:cytochrome c-type biogenesis protein CcmH